MSAPSLIKTAVSYSCVQFELVFTIVLLVNKNQVSNVFVKMSLVTCWWWLWHQSMWCTVTPNIINIFIVMNNNSTFSTAAATTRYFLALAVIATLFSIGTVDARLRFVSYDSKIFYRQIIVLMTGTRCKQSSRLQCFSFSQNPKISG